MGATPKVNLKPFKLVTSSFFVGETFSCNRTACGTVETPLLLGLIIYRVRNSALSGACSSSARGEKVDFSDILQPASPYMEMFTHYTDLLEEKEVTQGLGEAGFEFLFSETKLPPPPASPPPLCPLFWKLRRECLSAVPLGPQDHLRAVGLRVCERQ